MYRIKLKNSIKKRLIKTKNHFKRKHSFLRHILTKKSSSRKNFLGKSCFLSKSDSNLIKKINF